jgi:hypothetical protein
VEPAVVVVVVVVDTVGIAVVAELAVEAVGEIHLPVAMGSAMRIFGADVRVVGGDPSCLKLYSSLVPPLEFCCNPGMLSLRMTRGRLRLLTFGLMCGQQEFQQVVQES